MTKVKPEIKAKTMVSWQPLHTIVDDSYKAYAMYVVLDRAIPDVRDGLKPVQRRILYAMHDMGLRPTTPPKKSARIVGDVLGKYHPHGDQSIYDAMVRMAQDFTMRGVLVDGQGNFGSIDDDAAAMRYTEARLSALGAFLLTDIDKDTVEWGDNFDTTPKEPTVLPTRLPNLLLNGASGIAVGLTTSIPPHNLGELCDAVIYMCQRWSKRNKISTNDLMQFIHGPDFPTGSLLFRYRLDENEKPYDAIASAYEHGTVEGGFVCQAVTAIESIGGGRSEIIITALPYGVGKMTIIERIAKNREKFPGVTDVRDESDRDNGMRLVIETGRGHDPKDVFEILLKRTETRTSISYNAVGVASSDNGDYPVENMKLRFMLEQFVLHRLNVFVRRSKYELDKAQRRLHIVDGLLKALDALDEVIKIVRNAETSEIASQQLQKRLHIDDVQAQAILDLQIRHLARLNVKKLKDEASDLKKRITELKAIIGSESKQLEVIVAETKEVKEQFATPRRTTIVDSVANGAFEGIKKKKVARQTRPPSS